MGLNNRQLGELATYFTDVSKILVGSSVVGFFIPSGVGPISLPVFLGGSVAAVILLCAGLILAK